jgi:hypothetical protein
LIKGPLHYLATVAPAQFSGAYIRICPPRCKAPAPTWDVASVRCRRVDAVVPVAPARLRSPLAVGRDLVSVPVEDDEVVGAFAAVDDLFEAVYRVDPIVAAAALDGVHDRVGVRELVCKDVVGARAA